MQAEASADKPQIHSKFTPQPLVSTAPAVAATKSSVKILANMVAHLLAISLPLVVGFVALNNFSFFAWHPICMVVAYAFLMTEAMMIFSPESSLVSSSKRNTKVNIHGYLLVCALLTALGGFSVIYSNKSSGGADHFTSWHGYLGGITVAYTVVQLFAGVGLKYGSSLVKYLPKGFTLAKWKLMHGLSGCCLFLLGCLSVGLGLYSGWFKGQVHEYLWGAATIGAVFLGLCGLNHMAELLKPKRAK